MTDPDPIHDPDDPRGVASPEDPRDEEAPTAHDGGGGGIDDRLHSDDYPDGDGRETDAERHICQRCDRSIPWHRDLCHLCEYTAPTSRPGGGTDQPIESWYITRVAVAVVDAEGPWLATTTGKAALDVAVDNDGARPAERVEPASQFDDEPPYPLNDAFERLPDLLRLDESAADSFLTALDAQVAESPQLYDENGTPIASECDREAIEATLGEPDGRYWLFAGVVEGVTRTLPEELSTDDDSDHWAAAYPSEHERAMENYHEKHGRYPFEEPAASAESDTAD